MDAEFKGIHLGVIFIQLPVNLWILWTFEISGLEIYYNDFWNFFWKLDQSPLMGPGGTPGPTKNISWKFDPDQSHTGLFMAF